MTIIAVGEEPAEAFVAAAGAGASKPSLHPREGHRHAGEDGSFDARSRRSRRWIGLPALLELSPTSCA